MKRYDKAMGYAKMIKAKDIEYINEWEGYSTFDLMPNVTGCVGVPQILLVSDTEMRIAKFDEIGLILGWDNNSEDEE